MTTPTELPGTSGHARPALPGHSETKKGGPSQSSSNIKVAPPGLDLGPGGNPGASINRKDSL